MKRITALVLALVMVLALGLSALAVDTGKITYKNGVSGKTVATYKVYTEPTEGTYVPAKPAYDVWEQLATDGVITLAAENASFTLVEGHAINEVIAAILADEDALANGAVAVDSKALTGTADYAVEIDTNTFLLVTYDGKEDYFVYNAASGLDVDLANFGPEEVKTKGSITITNAQPGKTYELYKIFDVHYETYKDSNGDTVKSIVYTTDNADLIAAIEADLELGQPAIPDGGSLDDVAGSVCPFTFVGSPTKDGVYTIAHKSDFDTKYGRGWIANFIEESGMSPTATKEVPADANSAKFENIDLGYYAIINSSVDGESIVTVNTTAPDVEVVDKNPVAPSDVEKSTSEEGLVTVGQSVPYEISFTATNYYVEDSDDGDVTRAEIIDKYTVKDTAIGLQDMENISVRYYTASEDPTDPEDGTEIPASAATGDNGYVKATQVSTPKNVDLTDEITKTVNENVNTIVIPWSADDADGNPVPLYTTPVTVVIRYTMTVNEDITETDGLKAPNTVKVTANIGNDPVPVGEDTAEVKTTSLSIRKYNGDNSTELLSGAKFVLYKTVAAEDTYALTEDSTAQAGKEYYEGIPSTEYAPVGHTEYPNGELIEDITETLYEQDITPATYKYVPSPDDERQEGTTYYFTSDGGTTYEEFFGTNVSATNDVFVKVIDTEEVIEYVETTDLSFSDEKNYFRAQAGETEYVKATVTDGADVTGLYEKTAGDPNGSKLYYVWNATDEKVEWKSFADATEKEADNFYHTQEFKGLEDGTYYLTETVAPEGFAKLANDITVVITYTPATETSSESITVTADNQNINANVYDYFTVKVANTRGNALPTTGGAGTIALIAIGVIVFMATGVVLVTKKRMYNEG